MKRKASRLLQPYMDILIRDASEDRYPFADPDETKPRHERRRWGMRRFKGLRHDGLHFILARYRAFVGDDGVEWDYAEYFSEESFHSQEDPWADEESKEASAAHWLAIDQWEALPEQNRAWYEVRGVIPYEGVIDIDENGDEYTPRKPHLYVAQVDPNGGPYSEIFMSLKARNPNRRVRPIEENRVRKFHRKGELPVSNVSDESSDRVDIPDQPSAPITA